MKQIISLSNFHKPKPKTTSFWHGRKKRQGQNGESKVVWKHGEC